MESVVVSFTYPIVIFCVDISSIVTEDLQSVISVGLPSSHMQGSPLMERKFNINYLRDHVTQWLCAFFNNPAFSKVAVTTG